MPVPVHSPAMAAPKLKAPDRYSSVISTEEAQFGISPMIPAINGCQMLAGHQQGRETFLAYKVDGRSQCQGHPKQKQKDLQAVAQSGTENPLLAMAVGTHLLMVQLLLLRHRTAEQQVDEKAGEKADGHLAPQQGPHCPKLIRMGQKDGKGLVRGGKKHRHQGSHGDDAPGIKIGRHHRKTALGHAAGQSPHQRAEPSRFF